MKKTVVEKHFDKVADDYDSGKRKYSYYYENLKKLLGSLIPPGRSVFEIGCGTGDLLASLEPKYGYGMDISSEMVKLAKNKYQNLMSLEFSTSLPSHSVGRLDFIFMSDVIEHLEEPEDIFFRIAKLMDKKTVFVNTMANPIWEPLLMFWENMGWKMKEGPHNRIKYHELTTIFKNIGLKVVKHNFKLLMPVNIPLITWAVNHVLEPYFRKYAFIEYVVIRKI